MRNLLQLYISIIIVHSWRSIEYSLLHGHTGTIVYFVYFTVNYIIAELIINAPNKKALLFMKIQHEICCYCHVLLLSNDKILLTSFFIYNIHASIKFKQKYNSYTFSQNQFTFS